MTDDDQIKLQAEPPPQSDDKLAQNELQEVSGPYDRLPANTVGAIKGLLTGRTGLMVVLVALIWSGHWDVHGILQSVYWALMSGVQWCLRTWGFDAEAAHAVVLALSVVGCVAVLLCVVDAWAAVKRRVAAARSKA